MEPFDEICEKAGSQKALADVCGVKPQAVFKWGHGGRIPAKHVLTIETKFGVSRHRMRPDIFGDAPHATA